MRPRPRFLAAKVNNVTINSMNKYFRSAGTVGPMTRTVGDAALALNMLAGYDSRDPDSLRMAPQDYSRELDGGVQGMRIGVPKEYFVEGMDPRIEEAVRAAIGVFEDLGAREVGLGERRVAPLRRERGLARGVDVAQLLGSEQQNHDAEYDKELPDTDAHAGTLVLRFLLRLIVRHFGGLPETLFRVARITVPGRLFLQGQTGQIGWRARR